MCRKSSSHEAEVAIDGADSVDPSLNLVPPGPEETLGFGDVQDFGVSGFRGSGFRGLGFWVS